MPRSTDKLLPGPGLLVSRGLIYSLLVLMAAAVAWSSLAETDVVTSAPGKLVVKGEPLRLSIPEAAMVIRVSVEVGEMVRPGDTILVVDSHRHREQLEDLVAEREGLELKMQRHEKRAVSLTAVYESLKHELATKTKQIEYQVLRVNRVRELVSQGIDSEKDLEREKQELLQFEFAADGIRTRLKTMAADLLSNEGEKAECIARIRHSGEQIDAMRAHIERSTLRAPRAGVIVQLAVRHPGSVLSSETTAATIVPDGVPLMASMQVPNTAMRRLREGMPARVSFEAFPWQEFGRFDGRVASVEPDALPDGSYRVWIELDRLPRSTPGLALSADIRLERVTVMRYLVRSLLPDSAGIQVDG